MSQTQSRFKPILRALGLIGLARWLKDGLQIRHFAQANREVQKKGAPDHLPLPPPRLLILSAGTPDLQWYLDSGKRGFGSIQSTLASARVKEPEVKEVLDFGCGSGRVIRYWQETGKKVHGCDIEKQAIDWCRDNLKFASFSVNPDMPPTSFRAKTFDLVYAFSVLTHMPEDFQMVWMSEFSRILRRGGYLLISTHGSRYFDQLDSLERDRFRRGELVVRGEKIGSNRLGSYQSEQHVRTRLSSGFEVALYIPGGALGNPEQDLVLFRREGTDQFSRSSKR
ncbi:MAG TPA: methyltransferase domain-containing protein [Acidobacteriota bacterium]|nr:methyltransferase domain-containing protein [Acidobacteriota bacterium]